jgi:hypothetical protein
MILNGERSSVILDQFVAGDAEEQKIGLIAKASAKKMKFQINIWQDAQQKFSTVK